MIHAKTMAAMTQNSPVMDRFRAHVRAVTGITLTEAKVTMIHQRLRKRVTDLGFARTEDYLAHLFTDAADPAEMVRALDLITTNTTSFFREVQHFDYMADTFLPALAAKGGRKPRLKFWSAAASEGAEAYTIAMVLAEGLRRGLAYDFAVLGTDVSTRILEKASRAVFQREQLETVPPELRRRYFLQASDPALAGMARIVPELRRHVRFGYLNLMDDAYPVDSNLSAVFLRNVLIYFERETQTRVISRIVHHLAPGGHLFVGHSESMVVDHPMLVQVRPSIFRRA
ncbi:MAG: chemotaxis protein CheR [Cypionkella sp.]|jgi:chemotaxis protein methyltransferase CheR|nr:chemotaxis protein CheR [Cypionkella sp.]